MVIGIDASRANKPHKSGTEWYAYYLIRGLARLDDKNEYILYTDQPLQAGLLDLTCDKHEISEDEKIKFDNHGCQIIKSRHNNFKAKVLNWPFKFLWTQGRLSLEMLFHSPDLLFIPAHVLPVIHPKKSVVTIHDIGFKQTEKLYSEEMIVPMDSVKNRFFNFLIKIFTLGKHSGSKLDYLQWSTQYALKKAKQIITISKFSKKELLNNYKVKADKIKIVYNGYNNSLYRKIDNEIKTNAVLKKYGIVQPFIFYVGRLGKKKNTDKLIEAYAIMRQKHPEINHRLCLAGDASFGYDEIKYQVSEFGLSNRVIMPGWVEEGDMPYIFNAASAFIFPSNYEGFGIPLLQAMACGTPVTASNTSSIPEIAKNAALFFDQDDVYDMAKKIAEIIQNNKKRKELIKLGFERIKNFSWQKCAQDTLNLLNSL
ncbi:MAG: glycosyltransferase family 1 protein [bacterium]